MRFLRRRKQNTFNAVITARPQQPRTARSAAILKLRHIPRSAYFFVVVVAIAGGGVLYTLLASEQFIVSNITVVGVDASLEDRVRAHINERLSERYLLLATSNNTVFFPRDSITKSILSAFPGIEKVALEVRTPHTLIVIVTERKDVGVWCASAQSIPQCYFYDVNGVVYEDAPNAARGFLIHFVYDERKSTATLGDYVLDSTTQENIARLNILLAKAYTKPQRYTIANDREIHAGFSDGWEAYFSLRGNIDQQVEALGLVLKNEIGSRAADLEYVDVRLGSKIFYRFIGEGDMPTNTEEATSAEESIP